MSKEIEISGGMGDINIFPKAEVNYGKHIDNEVNYYTKIQQTKIWLGRIEELLAERHNSTDEFVLSGIKTSAAKIREILDNVQ